MRTTDSFKSVYNILMKIKILFFAEAKRITGLEETELDFEGVDISDLKELLKVKFSSLNKVLESSAFAVDKEYVQSQTVLKNGDTVAVIPPVEGG